MDLRAAAAASAATPTRSTEGIAWASPAMRDLEDDVAWASRFDVNIMISGEAGVGKRAIADRIHRQSRRARGPLAVLCVPDVPDSDVLTPLLLEAAPDGTILLEHPHWMTPPLQTRLLQFIERGTIWGSTGQEIVRSNDVRFLTVTRGDLFESARLDRFCESLFYRLNTIHLSIPPLRKRPEDIPVLLEYFFSRCACPTMPRLSAAAWRQVVTYRWPGNLPELRAAAETLASRELPRPLEPGDLPLDMFSRA